MSWDNGRYEYRGHSFTGTLGGKKFCDSCGHVALNNDISVWATQKGCFHELHPQYKQTLNRLTKGP